MTKQSNESTPRKRGVVYTQEQIGMHCQKCEKKVFYAPNGSSAEGSEFSDIFREEDVKQVFCICIATRP